MNKISFDVFDEARKEWKQLNANVKWTRLFGDLYVLRYPLKSGSTADFFKKSLYDADDSVHAFDASKVRSKIIDRVVKSEERGKIREWYADIAFFCESMNFLRGIEEKDIDWVIRLSLEQNGPFKNIRKQLKEKIDPDTKIIISSVKEEILKWSRPLIEFYGLLDAMKKRLFIYNENELAEIARFLLDPEKTDKFLRKRFISTKDNVELDKDTVNPLIGQNHAELLSKKNFILKYIAMGDTDFFPLRIAQIWLYVLCKDDPELKAYIRKSKSDLLGFIQSQEKSIEDLIVDAILLLKYRSIITRLQHQISYEYASKADYPEYASNLNGILRMREKLLQRLDGTYFCGNEVSLLNKRILMVNVGVTMIEAVLKKLESQIPEPQGAGMKRTIMAKRKKNLRNVVIPPEVKNDILEEIISLPQDYEDLANLLAQPAKVLLPRGEAYFHDLEEKVRKYREEMGQMDLKSELKEVSYAPQTLVKQYGKDAIKWLKTQGKSGLSLLELYATIMALKSSELLFDDATTPKEDKRKVSQWILDTFYIPQVQLTQNLYEKYVEPGQEGNLRENGDDEQ